MKKLFFGMLAIVAMIATSCQQEVDLGVNAGETATVSFNVNAPASRAYSDGTTATVLQYAVYDADGAYLPDLTKTTTINTTAQIELQLVTGNTYTVIFWADNANAPYTVDFANKTMTVDYTNVSSNNEELDAFYKYHTFTVKGAQTETIELRRPFAQLNIGTNDYEAAKSAGYEPTQSTVTVKNIYSTLNLWNGAVSDDTEVTFGYADIAKGEKFPVDGYQYLAMNYLLVPAEDKENIDVEFTYTNGSNAKTRTVGSVPVQRNHRTNLYGSILTSDVTINVEIKPEYETPDHEAALQTAATVGGEITLTEDVALEGVLNVQRPLTINLNGHTINGTFTKGGDGANAMIKNNATLTIVGGTIKNTTENGDAAIYNTGNLVLDGVKIEGAPIGTTGYPEYAVYSVGGTVVVEEGTEIVTDRGVIRLENGADVTINGGSFVVNNNTTATLTSHVIYAKGSASKLTINGGDFAQNIDNGGGTSVICPAGATINIYGGNFYHVPVADFQSKIFQNYMGYGAPVDVYGGTYNDDSVTKSGNLAAGYKAIEKNGLYYVVADNVDAVASTPAEVLSAMKVAGQTVCVMPTADGSAHKLEGKMSLASGVSLIGMGDEPVALFNDWGSNAFANQAHFTNTTVENINFTNNLVIDAAIANGDVHFKNCVFGGDRAHQGVHFDSGNATIVFDNCTFVGRNMLGASLTKVVFNNCTFLNKKSSLTGADKWTGVNMWGKYEFNNCVFDTEATCNVKCDGVEATFTNCKYTDNRNIEEVVNNYAGYSANIIIDGKLYIAPVATADALKKAINAGEQTIYVKGQIDLTEEILANYNGTIIGADDTACINTRTFVVKSADEAFHLSNKTINFKNITIKVPTEDGDFLKTGFVAAGTMNFDHCVFEGQVTLNGSATWTFDDCEFGGADSGAYASFVYGAKKVNFNRCSFSGVDRAAKVYGTGGAIDVEYNNCTFTSTTSNKFAVNIDASYATTKVALNGCSQTGMPGLYLVAGTKATVYVDGELK